MNSTVENTIKALVEHKKYEAITEYANVVHGKNNLIVSEYGGANVRLYKDNDNNVRILCPKKMETVQEGYLAKAIADGSVFDDAEDIDRNASVIERTTIPYDAMINAGKDVPHNLKPMIAIVVGRMGDDGSFGVTDADRENGVNFVKDVTTANANGDRVNGVVDHYLEKDNEGFYTPDIGKNITGLNKELGDVNDTDPADVVTDDDTVDSYDGYDMNDFERDPDAEPEPEEEGESDDNDNDDADSDDNMPEDNEEPVEDADEEPVEECGDGCTTKPVIQEDDETLTETLDEETSEEPVEEPVEPAPAEEEDPIATGIANSIISRYKRVSEYGNNVPTGTAVVQEDEDMADDISSPEEAAAPEQMGEDTGDTEAVEEGNPITNAIKVKKDLNDIKNGEVGQTMARMFENSENQMSIDDLVAASDEIDRRRAGASTTEEAATLDQNMQGPTETGTVAPDKAPLSATTKDYIANKLHQEGFLSKQPKKLKPIGRDVVAYITCEMNDIHSANDQAMLAGYTCSKIELVDWYITVLDTNDPKYMVPHTRQYLVTMKAQLESLLAQILKIRPINRSEQIWRVNYPSM